MLPHEKLMLLCEIIQRTTKVHSFNFIILCELIGALQVLLELCKNPPHPFSLIASIFIVVKHSIKHHPRKALNAFSQKLFSLVTL